MLVIQNRSRGLTLTRDYLDWRFTSIEVFVQTGGEEERTLFPITVTTLSFHLSVQQQTMGKVFAFSEASEPENV